MQGTASVAHVWVELSIMSSVAWRHIHCKPHATMSMVPRSCTLSLMAQCFRTSQRTADVQVALPNIPPQQVVDSTELGRFGVKRARLDTPSADLVEGDRLDDHPRRSMKLAMLSQLSSHRPRIGRHHCLDVLHHATWQACHKGRTQSDGREAVVLCTFLICAV